jgi:hypothetical protein
MSVIHKSFFVPQTSPCPVATSVGRGPFALLVTQRFFVVIVVVEAELFFVIETHTWSLIRLLLVD